MEEENKKDEQNVSRETNDEQSSEQTATQKVIEAYKQKYEEEHALRLQAEKEANELSMIMTNFSTSNLDEEKPKEQTLDEIANDLFGGNSK